MRSRSVRDSSKRWKEDLYPEWQTGCYQFQKRTVFEPWNPNMANDSTKVPCIIKSCGLKIQPGGCYQMTGTTEGEMFIQVAETLRKNICGQYCVVGHVFLHSEYADDIVPPRENEIIWIVDIVSSETRSIKEQALKVVPVEYLKKHGNISYQPHSLQEKPSQQENPDKTHQSTHHNGETKICRLIYFREYDSRSEYKNCEKIPGKGCIRYLNPTELKTLNPSLNIDELSYHKQNRDATSKGPHYMMDICHGAGGATEVAKIAGFEPVFAIDRDLTRHKTYITNNPDIKERTFCEDVKNFESLWRLMPSSFEIAVLHFSMSCKIWSIAKTRMCDEDYENGKTIFEMTHIINIVKSRLVSFEQVPGMLQLQKCRHSFYVLVGELVELGYSVSWGIFAFGDYGLPSKRKRLLLFASRQGEFLPAFPKPTHGTPGSGLLPFTTANDALAEIPEQASRHNVNSRMFKTPQPAWDGNVPLRHTPTGCSSSSPCHPSGERAMTIRELLRLQDFPDTFQVVGSYEKCRKQIADSVPPKAFSHFLVEMRKTLEETDKGERVVSKSKFEEPLVPICEE